MSIPVEIESINVGAVPRDGTGDKLRIAGQKINRNLARIRDRLIDIETALENIDPEIEFTGDVTGQGSGTIQLTLASSGVTAGVYAGGQVTFDAKGRATSATSLHSATAKATPADNDELQLLDSAASFGLKKLTWLGARTAIRTALDSIYQPLNSGLTLLGNVAPGVRRIPYFTDASTAAFLTLDDDVSMTADSSVRVPSQHAAKAYTDALRTYVDSMIVAADAMRFKGTIDCSTNPNYPAASVGDTYRVSAIGKIGGASGVSVEQGDILLCSTTTAAGTQAGVGVNWSIIQNNIDGAVVGPVSSTDGAIVLFNGTTGKVVRAGTLTEVLDMVGNPSRGAILVRGASGWVSIPPGTSGYVLTSNGAGADPSYAQASGLTSIADGSVTNPKLADVSTSTIKGRVAAGNGAPTDLTVDQVLTLLKGTGLTAASLGTRGSIMVTKNTSYTFVAQDSGKEFIHEFGAGSGHTYTIPSNANVPYDVGTILAFINMDSNTLSIAIDTDTLLRSETGNAGTRTLVRYGNAFAKKLSATVWMIFGAGLS